ncbi:MAG: hypothetical protein KAI29_06425 [Cyclobacteriaceae bacterium]|nr:hypothetical protein [Cyclobacteriaceae bacterium]MCK5700767.1 hypothetical protein [Cyclobacteriaceae bacterium]
MKYFQFERSIKIDATEYLGDVFVSLGLAMNLSKKSNFTYQEYSASLVIELNKELE